MTHAITSHSPELTEILFKAGGRVVVLVEGVNDQYAFRQWFDDRLSEVEFFDCGGVFQVNNLLAEFLAQSSLKRGYAIIDRDFRTEGQVEESYKPNSHCFVLRRYVLENYLIDAGPVYEELRVLPKNSVADAAELEVRLLELGRKLKTISAVQWVFWEKSVPYLPDGYDYEPRQMLVEKVAKELSCSLADAELLIAEKEGLIDGKLDKLLNAHSVISGKRLFNWVHRDFGFKKLEPGHFRNLLVRSVKKALPDDLKAIVVDRILAAA